MMTRTWTLGEGGFWNRSLKFAMLPGEFRLVDSILEIVTDGQNHVEHMARVWHFGLCAEECAR